MAGRARMIAATAVAVLLPASLGAAASSSYHQRAHVQAPDGERHDLFGQSVAMSDSVVVVGAPDHGIGKQNPTGELYVYTKPSNGWAHLTNPVATLQGPSGTLALGTHVAISGHTIVATAAIGRNHRPAVLVFQRPRSGWADASHPAALLVHRVPPADDRFGTSLAVSGGTVVVGMLGYKTAQGTVPGAVYVYVRPTDGWSGTRYPNARLRPRHDLEKESFGFSVAAALSVVVVGAPHWIVDGHERGAAFVFRRPGSGWATTRQQQSTLVARNGHIHDQLGYAVAATDNLVAVGAPYAGVSACAYGNPGSGYVFKKPGSGWSGRLSNAAYLTGRGCDGGFFGWSVATSGSIVVLGAPYRPNHNQSLQGAVYVFSRPSAGWSGHLNNAMRYVDSNGEALDQLGESVSADGKVVIGGASHPGDGVYAQTEGPGSVYVLTPG